MVTLSWAVPAEDDDDAGGDADALERAAAWNSRALIAELERDAADEDETARRVAGADGATAARGAPAVADNEDGAPAVPATASLAAADAGVLRSALRAGSIVFRRRRRRLNVVVRRDPPQVRFP